MKQVVIRIVPISSAAERIVDAIKNAAFSKTKISVLMPNLTELREMRQASQADTDGAVAEEGLGRLAGIGAITFPGIGPIEAAGLFVMTICFEAKKYYARLRDGNVVPFVHVDSSEDVQLVESIFRNDGNTENSRAAEKAVLR